MMSKCSERPVSNMGRSEKGGHVTSNSIVVSGTPTEISNYYN